MFEKVNPSHPDKIADRIAGAIVDLAYKKETNPKIAVEVLIGHNLCTIIIESSFHFTEDMIRPIIDKLIDNHNMELKLISIPQDRLLANNQNNTIKCGDNGIFKGMPVTAEQTKLTNIAKEIYNENPTDGKYVLSNENLVICQSKASTRLLQKKYPDALINPIGEWEGGIDVDSGATNRKLGSDMGDSVTGGGLHGKDLSKADVSVNIYAFLKAQETNKPVELYCAIGDETIDGKPYSEIVDIARKYITELGGFEKFAEWGLIR